MSSFTWIFKQPHMYSGDVCAVNEFRQTIRKLRIMQSVINLTLEMSVNQPISFIRRSAYLVSLISRMLLLCNRCAFIASLFSDCGEQNNHVTCNFSDSYKSFINIQLIYLSLLLHIHKKCTFL